MHENGRPQPDISFVFAHDAFAPRAARDAVHAMLRSDAARAAEVDLLVSELVSNVVLHTECGGRLDAWNADPIRVEVHDRDPRLPSTPVAADETGGRGLRIVAGIADRWGAAPDATGKVVWAEIAR